MKTSLYVSALLCAVLLSACGSSVGEADSDGDTVVDSSDNCPAIANTDQLNTDANFDNGDTLGDACDTDDDGDNVLDVDDAFDLDPSEWDDIDVDNIGDIKDLDVGNNNPSAALLTRLHEKGRATLFIGEQTDPVGSTITDVKVMNAGDVNGDGLDDLLIGVSEAEGLDGKVYLFFGSETPWPPQIDLANISDQVEYIVFEGAKPSSSFANLLGGSISALGDINADGLDDFLVGGHYFSLSGALPYSGEAYLVFGRGSWVNDAGDDHIITMNELKSQFAMTYQGQKAYGEFGKRVAAVGDVNGDNINDFLIGEYGYDQSFESAEGRVHLVFGGDHLQPPTPEVSGIKNIDDLEVGESTIIETHRIGSDPDTLPFPITLLGEVLLGLGNFDNDANNYADIAITSATRNKVYVLLGQETWPAVINLPTIDEGKGFIFEAPSLTPEVGIGQHIAAGDLNGDNIPELIISQPAQVDPADDSDTPKAEGEVVILKGGVGGWPDNLSLDNLGDFGSVWNTDEKLALGSGLAVLPDNNNDGFGELLINAPKPESPGEGLIFKVAGNANLAAKELNSTTTDAGVEIIRNLNTEIAGTNIRTLGDHNGDGINEFVIDIQDASTEGRTQNGLFYVIQGYSSLYPDEQVAE